MRSEGESKMRKKYKYLEAKIFVNSLRYELISVESDYIDTKSKIVLKDNNGYFYVTKINYLKSGTKPRFADKSNPYTIQNIKLWCKINVKPFELVSNIYEDNRKKLKWKCLKDGCGEIFESSWHSIFQNHSCLYCTGQKVSEGNNLLVKYPEIAAEWNYEKNDKNPFEYTPVSGQEVWWKCKECGYEWITSISSRNGSNKTGCPECSQSKGEKIITKMLCNKINYVFHYSFLDCKYKNVLEFDFYLPDYNMCIEYQGQQHYEPVDFAGKGIVWAEEQFKINQIRDQVKRDYCKENKIKLLEIPYWDFDNIENILISQILNII